MAREIVVDVFDRAGLRRASVVDDRPRTTVGHVGDLRETSFRRVGLGDIEQHGANRRALRRSRFAYDARLAFVTRGADHVVPRLREVYGGSQADTAVCSGDDDALAHRNTPRPAGPIDKVRARWAGPRE